MLNAVKLEKKRKGGTAKKFQESSIWEVEVIRSLEFKTVLAYLTGSRSPNAVHSETLSQTTKKLTKQKKTNQKQF